MKRKERYKLLNYAKNQYSKTFDIDYQFKTLSKKDLHKLLNQYKHSGMCEWWYCCYGLYENCWQDPYEEGIWDMTQKQVDKSISNIIDEYAKYYRKDNRILYYEEDNVVRVVLIMRDICKCDFLISFMNKGSII